MKRLFVEVTGQHDNIGDSLLRRGMLDTIRHPDIELHVQAGAADGYFSGLQLADADIVYRDRASWTSALRQNHGRGATSFLANAGEVIRVRGPRYLRPKLLVHLVGLRRRGGALLHTGVGVRRIDEQRWLAKMSALRFFDLVTWRDAGSRDYAGIGEVQPDWGFATGADALPAGEDRDILAVSVRGDHLAPSDAWIAGVRDLNDALGTRIVTFSQVLRDSHRAKELGEALGADDVVVWDSEDHAAQENRVRALMRKSVAVVSDRVHGLILGATEGAYPIGLPPAPNAKSQRTLAPVNFPLYTANLDHLEATITALPAHHLHAETIDAVTAARETLQTRGREIIELVLSR